MRPLHLLLFKTLISYWLFFPFLSSCPQAVSFIPNWLEMPWELADSTSHPLYQSRANLWVLISFLKHLLIHKAGSSPRVLVAFSWKPRASTDRYLGVSDEVERHLHVADQGPFEALRLLGGCFFWSGVQASLVAQTVKRLPATRETRVRFLGWEDPLEKETAIHSSTLA